MQSAPACVSLNFVISYISLYISNSISDKKFFKNRHSRSGEEKLRYICSVISIALSGTVALQGAALAQDDEAEPQIVEEGQESSQRQPRLQASGSGNGDVFELGRITVYGGGDGGTSGQTVSQSVVTSEDVRTQNRNTLDDALRTVPGVSSSNFGGSRNERMIYVRGFDRWQVPLSIDGVRIYLPADNRLDYGRFLTPDLAEIQIQKGYVSVLNGPGAMGGAINLVTRKPTRELEGELRAGFDLGNTGDLAAYTLFGSVGTRQELYYLQASGSLRDSDGWFLSRDYDPLDVGLGGPVQGPGRRDFSSVGDWRVNLKAGFTPNATDEYVISYTKQEGHKFAPYHVRQPVRGITPTPLPPDAGYQQDWTWPQWDVTTTSFNSHTQIGDASYVKTKAYYNTFDNLLASYDDFTHTTRLAPRSFDSFYNDYAYGFSVEAGTELIPMNTLKGALHYRRDAHRRWQHNRPDFVPADISPLQRRTEDTWSVAVENTFHATDTLDLVGGLSYDWYKTLQAEFFDSGVFGEYPMFSNDALNWQAAAIWRPDGDTELHASVSSRTRFPNLFERYSTRFGANIPNPDLGPERATNYQIGGTRTLLEGDARIGGALFYSDVSDAIQSVRLTPPPNETSQFQNVGGATYYGFEISGEWDVLPQLTFGGHYTYTKSDISDPERPGLKPIGVPEHLAYLYAHWRPLERLTVTPSVELSSSRYSSNRFEDEFTTVPGFGLVNLNIEYEFNDQASLTLGVRNILDKYYELADGFPEPGRTFYVNTRFTF